MQHLTQTIEFQKLRIEALTEALRVSEEQNAALRAQINPERKVSVIDINDPAFDKPYIPKTYGQSKTS